MNGGGNTGDGGAIGVVPYLMVQQCVSVQPSVPWPQSVFHAWYPLRQQAPDAPQKPGHEPTTWQPSQQKAPSLRISNGGASGGGGGGDGGSSGGGGGVLGGTDGGETGGG